MKTRIAIAILAVAMLCFSAATQDDTAESWFKKGQELYKNGSYQEALSAYDEGLRMDPQNASAWHYRGLALAGLGHGVEANQSLQKAIELLDQRLQESPEDPEALWLKAEGIDLLGRSMEALEAYGRVADLNSSHALDAWIRQSDILAALGRYNQSSVAFSRAMSIIPANKSESFIEFQRRSGNAILFTKAWLIDGQVHRISIGLYNVSLKSFDEIEQIDSDLVAASQLKGRAADPGRHGGFLMGSSLNWDVYTFNIPKAMGPAGPTIVTITGINTTGDEFIEVTNGLKEAIGLHNWSFEIQGSKVSLPEHSLLSGNAVRIHLGAGQENETDLFLDSDLELNDTTGSISLRDGSGEEVLSLDYWTKLNGSIGYSITAKGDFEYPGPDAGKIVKTAAGVGPFVAEMSEIGPESAHNHSNGDGDREMLQENAPASLIEKGL